MSKLEAFKAAFRHPELVHLNNAGLCPPHPSVAAATQRFFQETASLGSWGWEPGMQAWREAQETFARFVGCQVEEIAMMPNCATALNYAAFGLPLKKGEEILTWDQEYPSNAYPWIRRAEEVGAELRRLPSRADYTLNTGDLIEKITPRTRIIALSWVQFQSGAVTDLETLGKLCRKNGISLVVDVIQGLGVLPFHMHRLNVDIVCAGTHKWLCGPVGHGFMAVRKELIPQMRPLAFGAMTYGVPEDAIDALRLPKPDARRFEPGSPAIMGAIGTSAVLKVLEEIGTDTLASEALRLAQKLSDGLHERGHRVVGRAQKAQQLSPIVSFVPRAGTEKTIPALLARKISLAPRGGGIRLSPHAFNRDDEIEIVFDVLDSL